MSCKKNWIPNSKLKVIHVIEYIHITLYCTSKVEYLLVLFFANLKIAPSINVGVRLRPTNNFHNQQ